jgi:flagellar hook-length control protein FliK
MIAATPVPPASTGGSPGASGAGANSTPDSPFDAILTLEALAATCAALDTAALEGDALGLDEIRGSEAEEGDDADAEDGGPLAFLVNLLNLAAPATPAESDGVLDGPAQKLAADGAAGSPLLPGANGTAADADAAAAGKLQLADVAAAARQSDAGRQDAATQDSTSAMARAAEMLAQGPRHAVGSEANRIATPVHSPRWADDLGARVALMVRGAESSASLQLTPVDLGPVEVTVTVRDSQASIHFGAAQAETRALLEASIPKLREMLAAQGFNLMDASVSQGFSRQPHTDAPATSRADAADPEVEVREAARLTALGLLDTYA